MLGLTEDEASGPPVEVWEENAAAFQVFTAMVTQWRVGMNGPTGLDYAALEPVMRLTGVPRKEWPGVFADLRLMEDAALEEMRKG
jgi:hypothetical protein